MKAIYLTGFMGAGKTTIGKELAESLHVPVFDTDYELEKKADRKISEIFESDGEGYFRQLETDILQELPKENCVITTGGGIILKEENRRYIEENGLWLYLHCDPEEIERRLVQDETRPLLKGEKKKELRAIFEKRLPIYKQAELVIDTTNRPITEIVEEIKQRLNLS